MSDNNELNEEEQKMLEDIMKEEAGKESKVETKEVNKEEPKADLNSQKTNESAIQKNGFFNFYKRYMFLISVSIGAIFIALTIILEQHGIILIREVSTIVAAISGIGIFLSVFRLILKIKNVIARIIVGFLHTSFWLGLGLVIYIFIALLFPSGTKTVEYMGKTYVKQYGLFGTVSYHERINPIMVKSLSVDYELKEAIQESEYRYEK